MKIIIILPSLSYRGGERIYYTRALGLVAEGHEVVFVVGRVEKKAMTIKSHVKLIKPNKFFNKLFENDYIFFISSFFSMFYLGLKNSKNVDIVDTESGFALWAGYFIAKIRRITEQKKIKLVWTIFAYEEKSVFNRLMHGFLAKKADSYNALAPRITRVIKKVFGVEGVVVLIPAIDVNRFKNTQIKNTIEKYNLKNKLVVLHPAALHPKKNQEIAIMAVQRLKIDFPNIYLILTGSGNDRGRLQDIVKKYNLQNFVKFTGVVKEGEISDLYKIADAVLVTSNVDNEGLSMTALEALYCKTMPIVSSMAGVAEILKDNKIGLIYQPNQLELTKTIKSYLSNPKKFETILNRGNLWVKKNLTLKNYAKLTLASYEKSFNVHR